MKWLPLPESIAVIGETMKRVILVIAALATITGCETSNGEIGSTQGKSSNIKDYPEYSAHIECLAAKAFEYYRAEGSPLELGVIGSSACNNTRYALNAAITKRQNRYIAQGYTQASEQEDPKLVANQIIRFRSR